MCIPGMFWLYLTTIPIKVERMDLVEEVETICYGNPTKVMSSGDAVNVDPPVVTDLVSVKNVVQIGGSVAAFFSNTKGFGEVRHVVELTPVMSVEEYV
jgi:hypothetical protein